MITIMPRFIFPLLLLLAIPLQSFSLAHGAGMDVAQELDAEWGFVAAAASQQSSRDIGSVRKFNSELKYVFSPQVNKNLLVRFGAEWKRFYFGSQNTGAVPQTLQHVNAILGFDYQIAEQWLLRVEVQPGIYGDLQQISHHNVAIPAIIGATYLYSPDIQWIFGMRIDTRSEYPVFPAIGLRWQLDEAWTLNLILPQPRVEYNLNDTLMLYSGAAIKGGTYVMREHFGDSRGIPRLNRTTVDYTELRLGPGFGWKILPTTTLELEGGYAVWRTWNYVDKDVHVNSDPAPYLQFNCHIRF